MLWYLGTSRESSALNPPVDLRTHERRVVYSTSLMASLNAREALRTKYVQDTQFHTGASTTMPRFTTIYADGADSPAAGSMSVVLYVASDVEHGSSC